jgi:hypothetical protein
MLIAVFKKMRGSEYGNLQRTETFTVGDLLLLVTTKTWSSAKTIQPQTAALPRLSRKCNYLSAIT